MKIRSKRDIPKANKIFTDREEPRSTFWKCYNSYKSDMANCGTIKVLTYYGIGGIGKTTLLKKLISELDSKIQDSHYVYHDFSINHSCRGVLESLRNILASQYGFSFPLFDLGLYVYARKTGEDVTSPNVQALTEKSPLLDIILSTAGVLPIVGIISQLLVCADKGIAQIRSFANNYKRDILNMEQLTPDEIYTTLPYYFSKDMEANLCESSEPFVVFLDTYEQLVNEMTSVGEALENDEWIRGENGLIQNIPNVLWIIAGREKLKWERFNSEWSDSLEQHILGSLSLVDASSFLSNAGIDDTLLQHQLYDLTGGTPIYLDLCVDRFIALQNNGHTPKIEDFGRDVYSLISRYIRYMDNQQKDTVYVLACLQNWTDDMIYSVCSQILPSFSITTYEKVKLFSFVNDDVSGRFTIHQTVGSVLSENCPPPIKERTLSSAIHYCLNLAQTITPHSIEYGEHLLWAMRYGAEYYSNNSKNLKYFYETSIEPLSLELKLIGQREQYRAIFQLFYAAASLHQTSDIYAYALSEYADILSDLSQDSEAIACSKSAYELYRDVLDADETTVLTAYDSYASILSCAGEYFEAHRIKSEILSAYKRIYGIHSLEYLKQKLDVASLKKDIGNHNEALEMSEEALEELKLLPNIDPSEIRWAMTIVAPLYLALGKYQEALVLYQDRFEQLRTLFGDDRPSTIAAHADVVYCLSKTGKIDEAIAIEQSIFEQQKRILGEYDYETRCTQCDLALMLSDANRKSEAVTLFEDLLQKERSICEKTSPALLSTMQNLGSCYRALGRLDDAEELIFEVYNIRCEMYGRNHPDTLSIQNNIATFFLDSGDYEFALDEQIEVYERQLTVLGEDHPDTLRSLHNIEVIEQLLYESEP